MAIFTSLPGIEITIVNSNEESLEEYHDDNTERRNSEEQLRNESACTDSQGVVAADAASQDELLQGETLQDTVSQDAASQQGEDPGEASQASDSQDIAPKDATPQDPAAPEDATKGATKTCYTQKYIEVPTTNGPFGVRFSVQPPYIPNCEALACLIRLDSVQVENFLVNVAEGFSDYECVSRIIKGVVVRGDFRPFQFAEIKTSCSNKDKATVKREKEQMSRVGDIVVEVWRVASSTPIESQDNISAPSLQAPADVDERALKGKSTSHSVSFGEAQKTTQTSSEYEAKYLDQYPIAQARFRYRSKEALKQLLIIPRTPESSPEPKEAPAPACTMEDLNEEEQREVNEYIQKRFSKKCAAPTIKHERDDSSSDSSPRKRPRKPGEKVVIDLTED